jgi:hypothetical protein
MIETISPNKVRVTRAGVRCFNAAWPCSSLRSTRAYWFEFDSRGDLVDTDLPEQDDGPAASALSDDCKAYLLDNVTPAWAI